MSASSSRYARRRLSLLASSSLVAATLMAGVGGVATLAPSTAFAAGNECGDPSANLGLADTFTCAGAYPAGVTYPTTDGVLTLNLEDGVTITGGLAILGKPGDDLAVFATTNVANSGDPTITNPGGWAVSVQTTTANGIAVDLRSSDAGDAPIIISGAGGILAVNGTGNSQIRLNEGSVTATTNVGVASQGGSGTSAVYLTGGATVNSAGTAVVATSTAGRVQVLTTGQLTSALGAGIAAQAQNDVTVDGDGSITAGGQYGIYAVSNNGTVIVNTAAGTLLDVDNGYGIAAGVFGPSGGSVTVVADGDIGGVGNAVGQDGIAGVIFSSGNNSNVNVTANGDVYANGLGILNAGVGGRTSGNGNVTVTANGIVDSTTYGVVAWNNNVASTGNVTATAGSTALVNGDQIGLRAVTAGSGTATATASAGSTVSGGIGAVFASSSHGSAVADAGAASHIVGGEFGVYANGGNGSASSTIGDNAIIDPEDYGVIDQAVTDATTTLGNNVTIDINNFDNDAIAYGIYTNSTGFDTAPGNPSVEITAGTNLAITVDDGLGGEADGGIGIYGINNGGVTGSVDINIGNLFAINVHGDNVAGVLGQSDNGAIDITLGNGTITLTGGNGVDSAGTLPGSGGVAGLSSGGDVTIITNGTTITVANGAGLGAAGVYGETGGTADVDITTNGGPGIVIGVTGGDGVGAHVVDGEARVHVNNDISVTNGDGIYAEATGTGGIDGSNAGFSTITVVNGNGASLEVVNGVISFGLNGTTNVTSGDGISGFASGAGTVNLGNGGAITITTAGYGIFGQSNGGPVSVNNTGTISGVTGGIFAGSSGPGGTVSVQTQTGGLVSASAGTGIQAVASGAAGVDVDTGAVTGSAAGIIATSAGGNVTVDNFGAVIANGGAGIFGQSTVGGGVNVTTHSTVTSNAGAGINTSTVNGLNQITTGAAVSGTTTGINARAFGSGNILIDANAQVTGSAFGINAQSGPAGTGNVTVTAANVTANGATGVGVVAAVNNAASSGSASITIDANATILAGQAGLAATAAGTGSATVSVGNGVTIDPNDYGVFVTSAGGDATASGGNNVTIDINNTDADATSIGIYAQSGRAADAALLDPAVDVTYGTNLLITVDDGAGVPGDADGSTGILAAATGAAGSVNVNLGTGLDIEILGSNSMGINATSVGGAINVTTGGGLIDLLGSGADTANNYTYSAGINAVSATGAVNVNSNSFIFDNNNAFPGYGINAQSGGNGSVTVTSTGQILAGTNGIRTNAVDGATIINQNASVGTATSYADFATSTGTGAVTVNVNANAGSTLEDAVRVTKSGTAGLVTVNQLAGTTLTAGDDGIQVDVTNAASSSSIIINANGAIAPNTNSGVGFGIYTNNAGSGDTTINFNATASVSGAAYRGISSDSSGTGGVTVFNTGALGTSGDPINNVAIGASVSNAASSGGVNVQSTGAFGVFAGNVGISATNAGSGATQVFTNNGAAITVSNAGSIGINASGNGGLVQVANNVAITATAGAGSVGINAANVNGTLSVGTSGAISSTGDAIHTTNTGNGGSTVFTVAGGVLNSSAGDGMDVSGVNGIIDIDTAANVTGGLRGILATGTGTSVVTVDTTAASTVTGNGGDGINASSTGGSVTVTTLGVVAGNGGGDGIDASNTSGLVSVTTSANVTGSANGILATASGVGPVTVITNAASTVTGTGGDGINATSAGGVVQVTTAGAVVGSAGDGIQAGSTAATVTVTNNNTVNGTANGILTSNTGAGATNINVNANVTATGASFAAINAGTTGAGTITVTSANNRTITDTVGSAIRTTSNGGTVNIGTGTGTTLIGAGAGANGWVVDLNNAAGGTTNFTVGANSVVRSTDNTTTGYDDLAIRGVGGSVVVNNGGRIQGVVRFSGLTGNVVFNNSSTFSWHTTGASFFSPGADTLNNSGIIFTNAGGAATSWDFLGGSDTFINSGELIVGEPAQGAATLTLTSLDTWNNSGRIVFGSAGTTLTAASDGFSNDKIVSTGTTFNGTGGSILVMDANLGAIVQTSCAVLTAADCFDLTGGTTTGSTLIKITDNSPNVFGAFNPGGIVLVDVTGGTTAATHFSLDPTSSYWRADPNSPDGVLDKGLFMYDLILDPATKQHELVGVPDGEAFEFTTLGQAAQSVWYQTTGTWFDRQADIRDQAGDISGNGYGLWGRIVGGSADRDLISKFSLKGTTWTFDTSYSQNTSALLTGLDFVTSTSSGVWLFGGMVGYVDSDVSFNASGHAASMEGFDIGGYATYLSDGLFINAVINANNLDLSWQAPSLAPAGSNIFRSKLKSVGGQVEGGKTFALGASGFFEPLASLSYVKTTIDDVGVPGATIDWDDQTSFRGSLGARVGFNSSMDTFNAKFALTGRVWDEFEGENNLIIHSGGPDLPLGDDFSGTFGEIQGSVNLFSTVNAFSAFATVGTKFKDDYTATEGNLGFRWRW